MTTSHEFGPQLKARREQRGITLEALARGDVSHWPKGIFRRAFLREYAAAIGASADDTLADFLQLFPEDGRAESRSLGPLRMTLATVRPPKRMRVVRIVAGLADAGVVVLLGLIAAWSLAIDRPVAIAVAGLLYYPLTTGWLGRSLALSWWQDDGMTINRAWRTAPRRSADIRVVMPAATEPVRAESRVNGFQRDRRTGVDRRHAPRLMHEAEPAPMTNVFGLRKGSAA
jgi:transcriptional regulator with XRE-family HTH domain